MKRSIKVTLIVISTIISIILLDTIQALIFDNNPIIGIQTKCMKKKGILVSTYHCSNGRNITKMNSFNSTCNHESVCNNNERYNEIKESVKKAVEWNISAQYPNCIISNKFDEELKANGTQYNSSFLINNGYIKKSELLDIDKESYCDVFVKIKTQYEDPLDHQQNCNIDYKIYLKCNYYKDKGYVNWEK